MKKLLFVLVFVSLGIGAGGQENQSRGALKDLNVNFMMRGYFYAGSTIKDQHALGGFGPSQNFPKALDPRIDVRQGEISLIAKAGETAVFAEKYKGLKVLLVNGTSEQLGFPASDSRLYIVQEALDRAGKWRPVEYLPSSWCGNSYHTVFLGPNEYWEFGAARYTGKFKTKLRFRLDWQKSESAKKTTYSNEFDGSVNANQFRIQQGHKPSGLMDPYIN